MIRKKEPIEYLRSIVWSIKEIINMRWLHRIRTTSSFHGMARSFKWKRMGTKQEILGMVDNSGVWDRFYGDWNITISTLAYKLPTPPTTGVKKQYTFTCAEESSPRVIDAIAEGNDLYLKGISKIRHWQMHG